VGNNMEGVSLAQYEALEHRALGCDCCEGGECGDIEAVKALVKIALNRRDFLARRAAQALMQCGVAVAA
jgi:hypothetical protein